MSNAQTGAPTTVTESQLPYNTVSEALEAVKAKPGARVSVTKPDGWIIVSEAGGNVQWSFTPTGHYAYPAVVNREIKQRNNGDVFVEMRSICHAEKKACDKLLSEFEEMNAQMARNVQRMLQQQRK